MTQIYVRKELRYVGKPCEISTDVYMVKDEETEAKLDEIIDMYLKMAFVFKRDNSGGIKANERGELVAHQGMYDYHVEDMSAEPTYIGSEYVFITVES